MTSEHIRPCHCPNYHQPLFSEHMVLGRKAVPRNVRMVSMTFIALALTASSLPSVVAPGAEAEQGRGGRYTAVKARLCGSVRTRRFGRLRIISLNGGPGCRSAKVVAKRLARQRLDWGLDLKSPRGWHCSVALRPEFGHRPKYLVGCTKRGVLRLGLR